MLSTVWKQQVFEKSAKDMALYFHYMKSCRVHQVFGQPLLYLYVEWLMGKGAVCSSNVREFGLGRGYVLSKIYLSYKTIYILSLNYLISKQTKKKKKKNKYLYWKASLFKMIIPIDLVIIASQSTLNKFISIYLSISWVFLPGRCWRTAAGDGTTSAWGRREELDTCMLEGHSTTKTKLTDEGSSSWFKLQTAWVFDSESL